MNKCVYEWIKERKQAGRKNETKERNEEIKKREWKQKKYKGNRKRTKSEWNEVGN